MVTQTVFVLSVAGLDQPAGLQQERDRLVHGHSQWADPAMIYTCMVVVSKAPQRSSRLWGCRGSRVDQ
jgi:hypothetical protein